MAAIEDFLRTVRPAVPGCPLDLALNAAREALREFCTRTQLWRAALAPLDLQAGKAEYDLAPPADAEVAQVREVHYRGRALQARRVEDLQHLGEWRNADPADALQCYLIPTPTVIRFYPAPATDQAAAVVIHAALRPTRLAADCDDVLLDQWEATIAAGARFRLLSMREWRDGPGAQLALVEFQGGISDARVQVAAGNSRAAMRVRIPFFAGV